MRYVDCGKREYAWVDKLGVQDRGAGPHTYFQTSSEFCAKAGVEWSKPGQFDSPPPRVVHAVLMWAVIQHLFKAQELAIRSLCHAWCRLALNGFDGSRPITVDAKRSASGEVHAIATDQVDRSVAMSALLCMSAWVRERAVVRTDDIHGHGTWECDQGSFPSLTPWNESFLRNIFPGRAVAMVDEKTYKNHETWGWLERPSRDLCDEYCQTMRLFLQPHLGWWAGVPEEVGRQGYRPQTIVRLPRSVKLRQLLPQPVVQQMQDIVNYLPRRWMNAVYRSDVRVKARQLYERLGVQREQHAMQAIAKRGDVKATLAWFDCWSEAGYLCPTIEPRVCGEGRVTVEIDGINGDTLEDQRQRRAATAESASKVRLVVPNIPR